MIPLLELNESLNVFNFNMLGLGAATSIDCRQSLQRISHRNMAQNSMLPWICQTTIELLKMGLDAYTIALVTKQNNRFYTKK